MRHKGESVKAGLEIHQRLNTNKLFCNCPQISDDKARALWKNAQKVRRKLHVAQSELSSVDRAAVREERKALRFTYLYHNTFACLVELDEEPPHPPRSDVIKEAVRIASVFNVSFPDYLVFMRKTVVDGSNTSGFQRTALLGYDGFVEVNGVKVPIDTICLEEESAGIVERGGHEVTYSLHRLGIPLLEITTAPVITSGEQLRDVALAIGKLLRLAGGIRRGLGTIRQDVNISVDGGARVEIKGVQDVKLLPTIADYEVQRQKRLLEIVETLRQRFNTNVKRLSLDLDVYDVTDDIPERSRLYKWLGDGKRALLLKLPRFAGVLGKELVKGRRFGTELSDYAKTMGVGGIVHSDESPDKYGLDSFEVLKHRAGVDEEDAFVLVVAEEWRAREALKEVLFRASLLFVPEETRKANADGTTSFMRPLPTSARMYPETDIPIIALRPFVDSNDFHISQRVKLLETLGEDGERVLSNKYSDVFFRLVEVYGFDIQAVFKFFVNVLPQFSQRLAGVNEREVEALCVRLFSLFNKKLLATKGLRDAFDMMLSGASDEQVLGQLRRLSYDEIVELLSSQDLKTLMRQYRNRVEWADVEAALRAVGHDRR